MDKTITTVFLIIASVVAAVLVFNAVYPAIGQGSEALLAMTNRVDERMKSQIEIIHMSGELDASQWWQDANGDGDFDVFVWVKNVGTRRIVPIENLDVFFGPEGNFARIPHRSKAGGVFPYWEGQVENGADWSPTGTVKITLHLSGIPASGRYFIKIVIPNGVSDEDFFSM